MVTTSPADFWPLSPVVDAFAKDSRFSCSVVVTGSHVPGSLRFDSSVNAIERPVGAPHGASRIELARFAAGTAQVVAEVLASNTFDAVVLLGDRFEMLAVAGIAHLFGVSIVHLHGGELSYGSFDDDLRHAISKLSQLHLCATARSAQRLQQLGEATDRIVVVGAPGIERFLVEEQNSKAPDWVLPGLVMVSYHSPTNEPESLAAELEAVVTGTSASFAPQIVVSSPGVDPGSATITERFRSWEREESRVQLVPSLGAAFPAVLRKASCIVGNSSSGIIEAPALGVPTINVGSRQAGRDRASTVLDVASDSMAVTTAIEAARTTGHIPTKDVRHPYYREGTCQRIVEETFQFLGRDSFGPKRFVDHDCN